VSDLEEALEAEKEALEILINFPNCESEEGIFEVLVLMDVGKVALLALYLGCDVPSLGRRIFNWQKFGVLK